MVDLTCQRFFTQPQHPLQRQYEALRSIFVNQRSQKEVAEEFGYQYDSLRQLVCEFRRTCRASDDKFVSPFSTLRCRTAQNRNRHRATSTGRRQTRVDPVAAGTTAIQNASCRSISLSSVPGSDAIRCHRSGRQLRRNKDDSRRCCDSESACSETAA